MKVECFKTAHLMSQIIVNVFNFPAYQSKMELVQFTLAIWDLSIMMEHGKFCSKIRNNDEACLFNGVGNIITYKDPLVSLSFHPYIIASVN